MSARKPVVVDLFCGAGGESQGIHWALGDNIKLFAVNHWERACETHAKNFPADECVCQDIQTVIPTNLIKDRKVELMWASPECTNFSVARGGRPMDDQSRCTPFDILRWLTMLDVKRLIVENVKEFVTWGPLGEDDRPIPSRKGEFFGMFVNAIRAMGYTVDWRFCNAADYGAPTTRTRFFLQAVRGDKRIVWPEAQYGRTVSDGDLFTDSRKPWIPASTVIDWSLPCGAIDEREKPLAEATMKRILKGIERFWGEDAKPFLCRYNGGVNRVHPITEPVPVLDTSNRYGLVQPLICEMRSNSGCRPVTEPLSTVSTSGAHHALVESMPGVRIGFRMLQPHELSAAQSFPKEYMFTGNRADVVKQIGNAVCPKMAQALVEAV